MTNNQKAALESAIDKLKGYWEADELRALLADGGKGETVDFVFPPMPPAVVMHEKVGPLFDRLSMQFYASKCMSLGAPQAECAPREDYQSALDILANVRAHGGDFDSAIALLKSRQDRAAPREAQNVMNIPLDAAATMADYVPQAECASRAEDPDWMGKLPKCTEWPSGVAPRADAEKDAALTVAHKAALESAIHTFRGCWEADELREVLHTVFKDALRYQHLMKTGYAHLLPSHEAIDAALAKKEGA
jgi:hypothetical protein